MTHPFFTVVAALLAVGTIAWRIRAWQLEQRNREALVAFALSKGWDLRAPDQTLVWRWPGDPFKGGTDPRVTTVIGGTYRGRSFTAFEYLHDKVSTDSHGKQRRRTYRFTVCVLAMPGSLPVIQVEPESGADRAMEAVGWSRDQEFESEDFNRRFQVRTASPKDASDVLSPRTMQLLVGRPPFAWRTSGTDLVTWGPGVMDPMGLLARLDTMSAVVEGVPSFVWHDRGVGMAPGFDRTGPAVPPVPPTDPTPTTRWEV